MAKKPRPLTAPGEPTLLKGRKPITIPLHNVSAIFRMLQEHGLTETFEAAAKEANAVVTIHPETVNFVKNFVAAEPQAKAHEIGQKVINPSQNADRFDCTF